MLNDGEGQTFTLNITTASGNGTYRYFACITDPEPDLCGVLSDPVVLTDPMPPANPGRLTFENTNQDQDNIRAGDSLEFMVLAFCEGGPCPQSQVILYRSDDATINSSDDEVDSTLIPAIEESIHHLPQPTIDTTAPLTPGTYHYGLCLPGDDDSCVKIATITVIPPPDSRLILSATDQSEELQMGASDTLTFTANVTCIGNACPPFEMMILYRSDDAMIDTTDDNSGSASLSNIVTLGDGNSRRLTFINIPAPPPGIHHYGVCLPGDDNSCVRIATITVPLPDGVLSFNGVVMTNVSRAMLGEPINISVEIICPPRNTGNCAATNVNFYVSRESSASPMPSNENMETIGSPVPVAALAAGASRNISMQITATTNGDSHYFACIDNTNLRVCTARTSSPVTVAGMLRHISATNSSDDTFLSNTALKRVGDNITNVFRLSGMVGCRGGDCETEAVFFYRSNNETINGSEDIRGQGKDAVEF